METRQVGQRSLPGNALRAPALAGLFAVAALVEAVRCSSLSNLAGADVWWHLSSGLWILQNHSLPHSGLFSQSANRSWIAASWLYDLKLAIWYQVFGLRTIPIFAMFFKTGLAVITFLLAGGRRNFWPAFAVSAIAQYVLGAVPPTALYCSILLFGVEFLLLLESRRRGSLRILFWLPPLFLAWANTDSHFVYGVALLLLWLLAVVLGTGPSFAGSRLSAAAIAGSCLLSTLITPYFYHPYQVFFSKAFGAANAYLPDYKAPGFRQPQDYLLLLLAMTAFLALGLRRSRDLFLIAVLAISAALSFHSERDVWLTVLAAVAVIGEMMAGAVIGDASANHDETNSAQAKQNKTVLITGAAAILAVAAGAVVLLPRASSDLLAKAGQSYPVGACKYIREHQLPQPLFNAFEWGGFLTYYLPDYPVAIDGRTDLYGDDFVIEYSRAMNAEVRYLDFPAMANAETILLPRGAIMAQALGTLPAYRVAYRDDIAVVVARSGN